MEADTNIKISLTLFGMLVGGWISIATQFMFSTFLWGIFLLVVVVIFIFLRIKKGNEVQIGFGWQHMILILFGIVLNGLISTFLVGGL